MGNRKQNKTCGNKRGGFLGPSKNVVVMVIKDPRSNPEQFIHKHEVHENPQEMIQQIIGDQTRKPPIIEMPMNALPMNALPMNALLMDQLKNDYSPMSQSPGDDSGFIFETPEDMKDQSNQRKQTMKDIIQELSKKDTKPMLLLEDKPKKKSEAALLRVSPKFSPLAMASTIASPMFLANSTDESTIVPASCSASSSSRNPLTSPACIKPNLFWKLLSLILPFILVAGSVDNCAFNRSLTLASRKALAWFCNKKPVSGRPFINAVFAILASASSSAA